MNTQVVLRDKLLNPTTCLLGVYVLESLVLQQLLELSTTVLMPLAHSADDYRDATNLDTAHFR